MEISCQLNLLDTWSLWAAVVKDTGSVGDGTSARSNNQACKFSQDFLKGPGCGIWWHLVVSSQMAPALSKPNLHKNQKVDI